MFKEIFLILVLVHILGDFYFQSDKLSKRKDELFSGVLTHSFIYALVCLVLIIVITDEWIKSVAFTAAFMHFIIDSIKYKYIRNCKSSNKYFKEKEKKLYAIDQVIHIITFVVISLIITRNYSFVNKLTIIDETFKLIQIPSYKVFTWVLIILFVGKPANVTIKKLLLSYRPSANETVIGDVSQADQKKAGAFIGFLERFIIVIFLAIGQYSAIGLVLTAKSIARYDKISKNQLFAEYYLLGTLLSVIIVMITYFLIM